MKFDFRAYPHPVLGNGNNVNGLFNSSYNYEVGKEYLSLSFKFVLQNDTLEKLISERQAAFVVFLECSNTFYRKTFEFYEYEKVFNTIKSAKFRGKVDIAFFICATKEISNYSIVNAHPVYSNYEFIIQQGDVLAYSGSDNFNVDIRYDALKYVSSIMEIVIGKDLTGPMKLEFEFNKIRVILSKEDYDYYNRFKSNLKISSLFHSSIVVPVLLEALKLMGNNERLETLQIFTWFQVIIKRLENLKLTLENDHLKIAQILIENPLSRSLKAVDYLIYKNKEDEDNE